MSKPYAQQLVCRRLRLVIRLMLPEILLDHETYETQSDEFPAYRLIWINASQHIS
jgi:hypothetical protein